MLRDKVGDRIRTARNQRDLTQAQLAERASVIAGFEITEGWVAAAERYRPEIPDIERLRAIARALDVRIRDLAEPIGWYDEEPLPPIDEFFARLRGLPLSDRAKENLEGVVREMLDRSDNER